MYTRTIDHTAEPVCQTCGLTDCECIDLTTQERLEKDVSVTKSKYERLNEDYSDACDDEFRDESVPRKQMQWAWYYYRWAKHRLAAWLGKVKA